MLIIFATCKMLTYSVTAQSTLGFDNTFLVENVINFKKYLIIINKNLFAQLLDLGDGMTCPQYKTVMFLECSSRVTLKHHFPAITNALLSVCPGYISARLPLSTQLGTASDWLNTTRCSSNQHYS